MANKKGSKGLHISDKNARLAYKNENRHSKNRAIKLKRHIKNNPGDENAEKCLNKYIKLGFPYRRVKAGSNGYPKQKKFKIIKSAFGYLPKSMGEQLCL